VHLVGFTVEIYHDARSHERQKSTVLSPTPGTGTVIWVASLYQTARRNFPENHNL